MTISERHELYASIGANRMLLIDSLAVPVKVLDVKVSYGDARYLVRPVGGTGEQWFSAAKITETRP